MANFPGSLHWIKCASLRFPEMLGFDPTSNNSIEDCILFSLENTNFLESLHWKRELALILAGFLILYFRFPIAFVDCDEACKFPFSSDCPTHQSIIRRMVYNM
jgi:hypothetical protein